MCGSAACAARASQEKVLQKRHNNNLHSGKAMLVRPHEGMNRHASHNHGTATNSSSKRIYPHYNPALQSYKPPSEARIRPADNMDDVLYWCIHIRSIYDFNKSWQQMLVAYSS
jgi:hypothetical protein